MHGFLLRKCQGLRIQPLPPGARSLLRTRALFFRCPGMRGSRRLIFQLFHIFFLVLIPCCFSFHSFSLFLFSLSDPCRIFLNLIGLPVMIAISFIIICFDRKHKDFRCTEKTRKTPRRTVFCGRSGVFKGRISISLFFFCLSHRTGGNFDDSPILPGIFVFIHFVSSAAEKSPSAAAAAITDRIDRHALAAPFAEIAGASLIAVAASHVGIPLAAALELV